MATVQQLRHKYRQNNGSTKYILALWSLFFLAFLCVSCLNGGKTESGDMLQTEVEQMHRCRLKADNLGFYVHKHKAEKLINALHDSSFDKEVGRYYLVLTDYYIQTGNRKEARELMDSMANNVMLSLNTDTLLWLDYLCHQGNVAYRPYNIATNKNSILSGYDCLVQCYIISTRRNYSLYKGISMKLLSKYLLSDSICSLVKQEDPASLRYMNEENVSDTMLAGNLAERALCEFLYLNNPYQTADSWRSLALCFFTIGNAERSVECLHNALANPAVDSIPALKSAICQQMSMSYAALNDKYLSDKYRNDYLDIQDYIRQDRQLEARMVELNESTRRIWYSVVAALLLLVLLGGTTLLFNELRKRRERKRRAYNDEVEQLEEQEAMLHLRWSDALRIAVEQRSRVAYLSGMLPLADRLRIALSKGQTAYAGELADGIVNQNERLTQWIKLRQGSVAPRIEVFDVTSLYDVIRKNERNIANNGISLSLSQADETVSVRADRILTLFMLNTLIDNAVKANPHNISINAETVVSEGYAEITVSDDGKGMEQAQVNHLFDRKPISDDSSQIVKSHGFGLQNCRGIIDRYRKLSSSYSVCSIWAKSEKGRGTIIGFRLPLVVKMIALFVCMAVSVQGSEIRRYADSLYNCNVEGRSDVAMQYADSCEECLRRKEPIDSATLLSIYNETAVAALSLHEWDKYLLYNYRYTTLYQACTADKNLPLYCGQLEHNKRMANIAMSICVLLLLAMVPAFWFIYLRHVYRERKDLIKRKQQLQESIAEYDAQYSMLHIYNNVTDNHLSVLKHETMYYPSRISQMVKTSAPAEEITPIADYYCELYMLLLKQMTSDRTQCRLFPIKQYTVSELFPCLHSDAMTVANHEMMDYLQLLLKRHNSGIEPEYSIVENQLGYHEIHVLMSDFSHSITILPQMFSSLTQDTDFLVMRQILREMGEASMCYGCGISVSQQQAQVVIKFTLPAIKNRNKT